SAWNNASQISYTNNPNGTVNQSTVQSWTAAWQNQSRSTFTYNASDNILTDLTETWSGSGWENNSFDTYSYDGPNLTSVVTQQWISGAWQNDRRALYTNDSGGNPIQIIGQIWIDATSVWENESRITFTYNLGLDEFAQNTARLFPNPATHAVPIKSSNDLAGKDYRISD